MDTLRAQGTQESGFGRAMATNEFENFVEAVRDLWPRCKTTQMQLRVHWIDVIYRHSSSVVSAALSKCVSDFPDDTAPKWKVIFAYLAGKSEGKGGGKSEFELLLNQSREACKGDAVPTSGNLSDEDAWLRWLKVLTQEIRTAGDGRACTRCERIGNPNCGLLESECHARTKARWETRRWCLYLEDRGDPIPHFLEEDYDPAACVEAKPANGRLF